MKCHIRGIPYQTGVQEPAQRRRHFVYHSDPDNCWSFTSGIFNADNTLVSSLREDKVDDPSAPSSLTSILSTELTWTPSTKYFEAYMTPYKGYALRTLKVRLPGGKEMKYKIQLTKE